MLTLDKFLLRDPISQGKTLRKFQQVVFTLRHSRHVGGQKQKIFHQLLLFVHQQLYIAALSSLSLEIGCKPPIAFLPLCNKIVRQGAFQKQSSSKENLRDKCIMLLGSTMSQSSNKYMGNASVMIYFLYCIKKPNCPQKDYCNSIGSITRLRIITN